MSQISPQNSDDKLTNGLYSFWKFSRPHTIIGTSLSVLALYIITLSTVNLNISTLLPALGAWVACLCGNIYIVGLNQLEDIEIDQINKPDLPLAAGELSPRQGQIIVVITGILALVLSILQGYWLFLMVGVSLAIGTAYSLPPIRLKQFPFWAAFCIFTVRGVVVNLGLFLHFSWVFHQSQIIPASVWTLTLFIVVFTFAIAIFKDIPDLEGDKQYNISTFTIKLGKAVVFSLARWVITSCYLGMIFLGIFWLSSINTVFFVTAHIVALSLLWRSSFKVDLQNKLEITNFYQFIWKLFFLEYIIFTVVYLQSYLNV